MKYEDIKKANAEISTIGIKRWDKEKKAYAEKPYAEVAQRVAAFRKCEVGGAIITEIISYENGICRMKATVYDENGKVISVGHAQEREDASEINKVSCLENCETSAVGRALAFCGFGISSGIASAEEIKGMEKVIQLDSSLLYEAGELGIDIENVAKYLKKKVTDLTNEELLECIEKKKARSLK